MNENQELSVELMIVGVILLVMVVVFFIQSNNTLEIAKEMLNSTLEVLI